LGFFCGVAEHEQALRAAFESGIEEYGDFDVEFDAFCERATAAVAGRDAAAALGSVAMADLYLALACELRRPGAWETFATRFDHGLKAVARRCGAPSPLAEELVSELPGALIHPPPNRRAETLIGTYDASGTLFSWLATILQRRLIDRRRKERPHPPPQTEFAGADPPMAVVDAETGRRLREALKEAYLDLSTRESHLLVWKFLDNLPQQEMARRLDVSEARISQLLKRTTEKVRTRVLDRIRDESSPTWASRDALWTALKDVVAQLLSERRID
jgi:RNA polymerase sigma factor (sigma-70 family)